MLASAECAAAGALGSGTAAMNIFRFLGDMSHILSFLLLLHKIVGGKSAAGISLRTAEMYAGASRAARCSCPPARWTEPQSYGACAL